MKNIEFQQHKSERLYPIGYEFILKQGKQSARNCTVIDYLIEHNSIGMVVAFSYVIAYDFLGQRMAKEVVQVTIDRAINNGWKDL